MMGLGGVGMRFGVLDWMVSTSTLVRLVGSKGASGGPDGHHPGVCVLWEDVGGAM
jgi:hypothetical protein